MELSTVCFHRPLILPASAPLKQHRFSIRDRTIASSSSSSSSKCFFASSIHGRIKAPLDRELHAVFELASDAELHELSNILYGQSLLSPILKSVTKGDGSLEGTDHEDEQREDLIERLEMRFLYLAANSKETLRGWRPSYRNVLLCVRMKLNVCCSTKLSTEDLEAEIFLHLLQQSTRESHQRTWNHQFFINSPNVDHLTQNSRIWPFVLKLGGGEMLKILLKGGGAVTISFLQKMVARRLCGNILVESTRYQLAKEVLKKGGQVAALNLQTRIAALGARQGLLRVASCYATVRTTSLLLGPLVWGTLLADVVIKSVGTDYARIIQAIYAFAQIRLLRTYGWTYTQQGLSN